MQVSYCVFSLTLIERKSLLVLGAIVFVLQPCLCASCQPDFLHPLILLSFSLPLELFTLTNMEGEKETSCPHLNISQQENYKHLKGEL